MILIGSPYKQLPLSGIDSKYFAAHNPIIIPMRRIDRQFNTISNNGGFAEVTLTTAAPAGIAVGQRVYVYTLGSVGSGVYTITGISGTDITIDLAYTATSAGGINFLEALPRYYILAEFYKTNWVTSSHEYIGSSKYRPMSDGYVDADISRWARQTVNMEYSWTNEFTINRRDTNASAQMWVRFTEMWDGSAESPSAETEIDVVNAAMQVGHRYWDADSGMYYNWGSNMADFVPVSSGDDVAKWLTVCRKPKFWQGLPFSLSFIYGAQLSGVALINKKESLLDINGSVTTTHTEPLNSTPGGISAHPVVNQVGLFYSAPGRALYGTNVTEVKMELQNAVGSVNIFQPINVRIESCIPSAPVYLAAMDYTGGWVYYCFGARNVYGINTNNGTLFSRWYSEIATQNSDMEVMSRQGVPEITVGADGLNEYDSEIIGVILNSPKVLMLMNPLTWQTEANDTPDVYQLPQWQVVRPKTGKYNTRNNPGPYTSIEFTIEQVTINNQQQ